ncbi:MULTISPECIES: malonate decarboxylase holo-ACP synthase [Pseudomonas]|uniref:malonate decarboxylase holo-ACP synthase n=1 Tax=Pseudomonas TaxID=286 RepID=UPI000937DE5A|nr:MULTISPECIES: malonate decarboxylase holo-ACP synthase [Pseudomonas]OJT53623.1 phosphoribosyl-dephospho-CoA transferase [Pseudomonas moraviensis]UVL99344.1 malonate decarboxylase holo-ACP synthase [Pseudomonas atacamensis]
MVNLPLAHDLLWGMTPAQLPADAPAWAIAALAVGQPVVVRRALSEEGLVAVGVRGVLREQRLATFMPLDSIACRVSPEALCQVECERDLPVMQALKQLRPILDDCGWVWGVSGSVGFELASGFAAMHAGSDLDLILRAPQMITRNQACKLVELFDQAVCRVDMQLQTPFGAVALREWASGSARVLLKNAHQAALVTNPWHPQEQAA